MTPAHTDKHPDISQHILHDINQIAMQMKTPPNPVQIKHDDEKGILTRHIKNMGDLARLFGNLTYTPILFITMVSTYKIKIHSIHDQIMVLSSNMSATSVWIYFTVDQQLIFTNQTWISSSVFQDKSRFPYHLQMKFDGRIGPFIIIVDQVPCSAIFANTRGSEDSTTIADLQ
tara:strand:+ start:805 stop:1323 length:519 start_codon:yes stop_codon:yes gene_type:complete